MASAQKTFELQYGVKQNAEEVRNKLNELYNWEKVIKDKERDLKRAPPAGGNTHEFILPPVRSQVVDNKPIASASGAVKKTNKSTKSPSNENANSSLDASPNRLEEANVIKERGNNFVKKAQYEKAIEAYTDAIDLYNKEPVYFINRALCYLKLNRFETCIEDCEMAIELDRHCVKAYYRRMQANESLGNQMDALKDCTTVLLIEPNNTEAKKSLQRINEQLRKQAPIESGPNFSAARPELVDILPIEKPVFKHSNRPLRRMPIVDVVCPKNVRDEQNNKLHISDEDIDKIFNSNCGPFEEIKKPDSDKKPQAKIPHVEEKVKVQKPIKVGTVLIGKDTRTEYAFDDPQDQPKLKQTPIERPLPPAPTSTGQFYSVWKELSPIRQYQYLKSIDVDKLCKILGAGFDSDTLTGLIKTLRDYYVPNKEADTAATLAEIGKNAQTAILALLMSTEEKEALKDVIATIKQSNDVDKMLILSIEEYFSLR